MGSREVHFYTDEICDICGKVGAYDFMGDCLCPECVEKLLGENKELSSDREK